MVVRISREAREELLAVARDRYRRASKQGKSRVLNELVVWMHCHRKTAIRLLNRGDTEASTESCRIDRRVYDEAVREARRFSGRLPIGSAASGSRASYPR